MGIREIKAYIINNIKPYKFRYEIDQHNKQYYFVLYNYSLKSCMISIAFKSMKDDKIMKNKMETLKQKYENL